MKTSDMLDLGTLTVTYQHNATTENFLPVSFLPASLSSPVAPSHITTLQREALTSAAASWFQACFPELHLSAVKKSSQAHAAPLNAFK